MESQSADNKNEDAANLSKINAVSAVEDNLNLGDDVEVANEEENGWVGEEDELLDLDLNNSVDHSSEEDPEVTEEVNASDKAVEQSKSEIEKRQNNGITVGLSIPPNVRTFENGNDLHI